MKSPIIVGFTGPAQSGKDTAAAVLVRELGYKRMALADPLKADLVRLDPIIDAFYGTRVSDALKFSEGNLEHLKNFQEWRRLCQYYGTEVWRANDPDIWVKRLWSAIELDYMDNKTPGYVVPDVRFPNERREIPFDMVFRIHRPDVKPTLPHASEQHFAAIPISGIIKNDGTLEDLELKTLHAVHDFIQRFMISPVFGNENMEAEQFNK